MADNVGQWLMKNNTSKMLLPPSMNRFTCFYEPKTREYSSMGFSSNCVCNKNRKEIYYPSGHS